eukprot:7496552-Alexandrium_andersonii.AAC.1
MWPAFQALKWPVVAVRQGRHPPAGATRLRSGCPRASGRSGRVRSPGGELRRCLRRATGRSSTTVWVSASGTTTCIPACYA